MTTGIIIACDTKGNLFATQDCSRVPQERNQSCALNKAGDTHSTWPKLLLVEEAPSHHLLAERHYIGWVIQAPVFMGPELACTASSSLNLVHQEGTAMLFREQGKREANTCKPPGIPPLPYPLQAGAQL